MLFGKHINKYYKKYWYFFLIGIIALIAVDWIQLYMPEFLGKIVDLLSVDYVESAVIGDVLTMSLYIILIAFGMMLGRTIWRLSIFAAAKRIEAEMRQEMFEKATLMSRDYFRENSVGTLMNWITSDTEVIQDHLSWGTVSLIDSFFLSILVIVKMVMLDYIMSILCLIPFVLIVLWGLLCEKLMSKKWEERQKSYDKLYSFSEENFTGIRVIKAFRKERKEIYNFLKIAKDNKDAEIRFMRFDIIFSVVIEILLAVITFLILSVGGYFVYLTINGQTLNIFSLSINVNLTPGKLVTFFGYYDSIIWPMIALGQIIAMHARAKTSLMRISEFLDAKVDIKDDENAIEKNLFEKAIRFNNLSFKFKDGEYDCLKNISLTINKGEKIGVVGKIGSGKTTLVNLLLRLFNVDKGSIFIDDVDIMDIKLNSLHNLISYVPQDNFLFSDTIKDNIAFSDNSSDISSVIDAAKFANVDNDISNFENGYDTVLGERGVTLSGGQKQRISIARAYFTNSPILIMDDSVSAVDVSTEKIILNNIKNYCQDKTLIVIASRVSTLLDFDRIIVLNDGEVECFDSPDNLIKNSKTFKKMYDSQKLLDELSGGKK